MDNSILKKLVSKHGIKSAADEIYALSKESIRLVGSPPDPKIQGLGASRLGGQPDLPADFVWPTRQDKPMSFVAQIRLEDLTGFPPARDLPAAGLLSFFYDSAQETFGGSPEDRGGWQVAFFERSMQLNPAAFPATLPQKARFAPLALQFHLEMTLPVSAEQVNASLHWDAKTEKNYEALLHDFSEQSDKKAPRHRMFGWPDQIQDDMQLQAAMMTSGVQDVNDPGMKTVAQEKNNWLLLLQVDSDDRTGMRWASYGMLYFWIDSAALKAQYFDRAWLVLQSE